MSPLVAALLLGASGSAVATDVLLGERAAHPLSALFGVPDAARRSGSAVQLVLTHGNAYMGGVAGGERLRLDGETSRLLLRYRQSLTRCTTATLDTALVWHGGGSFDAGIETWHDWFGLRNAGREFAPRDELLFRYIGEDGGGPPLLDNATSGVADSQLAVQHALSCSSESDAQTLVRLGVKFPTGRLADWTGSEAMDVWADVQSPVYSPRGYPRWRLAASAGALLPGDSDAFSTQQPVVGFGAFGVHHATSDRLALHATIDWHTPLVDSDLPELGTLAVRLSTGASFAPSPRSRIDIQLLEDVAVDTATDVAVRISLTVRR